MTEQPDRGVADTIHAQIESLESRRMLAVSQDAAGWTVVTPASDTRMVHVSSSGGNDANDGSTPSLAVQTLTRAKSLVRNGFADWMLLKRGDTFGTLGTWNKWGRSPQEPMYITAYGDPSAPRPQLNTGTTFGLNTVTSTNPNGVENLIISSLSFFPDGYNHTNAGGELSALRMTAKGRNILIEDVKAVGYKDNIVIAGENSTGIVTDVTVRRSQILDAHAGAGVGNANSQGIYVGGAGARVTIEENVLDHNGWRDNTPADRTDRNHNIYIFTGAQDIIIRDNISTQAGFYGAKVNPGGTVTGNFFARNSESVYMEAHTHAEGNVITAAVDWDRGANGFTPWGVGINTQKSPSATIRHNLITKVASTNASGVAGIQLFNQGGVNFRGTVDFNTVYSWRNALLINAFGNGPGSINIRNNDLQAGFASTAAASQRSTAPASTFLFSNNRYSSGTPSTANKIGNPLVNLSTWIAGTGETSALYQTLGYPNAERSIANYAASISIGSTFDAFIAAARAQEKAAWNPALTAAAINPWFWDGFDLGAPPTVLAARAALDTLPLTVDLTLSKDVGSTLTASDVVAQNLTSGQLVSPALSYSTASTIARVSFTGALPDGVYTITIPAGSIADRAGRVSTSPQTVSLTLLAGDANRDGSVTLDDFTALAANFGQTGRVFSQGDFDYNGAVNLNDFTILAARFGQSLPAGGARGASALPGPWREAPTFSAQSIAAEVL